MSKRLEYVCVCEDSSGMPHNIPITKEQFEQDGMCWNCADNVWEELNSKETYEWRHNAT